VITKADPPVLVKGRSKTLPVVVFVTVLLGVVGLVFMLENLRPRIRPVDDVKRIPAPEQRSA
jgi:capsular polysaccharide biosynthesis protein